MPLEATMMLIDNSEYMRNGDYQPTRFDAQSDAVNTIFQTKIDSNPENTVGVMTMAGKGPEVLVTHTKDLGQILKAVHSASSMISGSIDILTSIAIAQLALKHRENKNLRQRIIVFVASPVNGAAADEKNMTKLAKKLKKNNVAIDIVAFGDGIPLDDKSVLKILTDGASSNDNSHLVSIPSSSHLLSDVLLSSPILASDRGIPEEAMGDSRPEPSANNLGSGSDFDVFGVDPSLDPELAMALRMSMQEAQARVEAEQSSVSPPAVETPTPGQLESTTLTSTQQQAAHTTPSEPTDEEEEALLQQALKMSEAEGDIDMPGADMDEEVDDEEAIARAIAMGMPKSEGEGAGKK